MRSPVSASLPGSLAAGLILALAFFLIELSLPYRDGQVEADGVRMSYGIAHAIRSGEGLAARDMYGRSFSFGYYALFLAFYPRLSTSFSPLVACMNTFNLLCVSAAFIPLVAWMSALWGRRLAVAAGVLLATTPIVFELGATAHPEGPAFLALNTALALFIASFRLARRAHDEDGLDLRVLALRALAAVTAFGALTLRADVLLGFPLFAVLAPMAAGGRNRGRAFAAGVLVAAIALAGFLAAQAIVLAGAPAPPSGQPRTAPPSTVRLVLDYWAGAKRIQNLFKGVAVWAVSLGPLLAALSIGGVLAALRRRDRTLVSAALAILGPSAVLWLPDPSPARHFLISFLVLIPAALLWLRDRVGPKRFATAATLLVLLNIASMAAAYPLLVRHYDFPLVTLLPRRVSTSVPFGDPLTNRLWTQRQVALEVAEARALAMTSEPRLLVFGTIVTNRLLYEIYAKSPSYEVEYVQRFGAPLIHATTPKTEYWMYLYAPGLRTPEALLTQMAAAGAWRDFAVAIVPTDQPEVGAARIPPGYRAFMFALDELGDRADQ